MFGRRRGLGVVNSTMNSSSSTFHSRALVSVLTGFAFLLLVLSGAVLFLAPPGRVANWTNWSMIGLTKSQWGGVHIWFAIVFLAGSAVHIIYNLRPLFGYFKNRATRRVDLRREWLIAGGICAVVFVGTLTKAAPFEGLLAWNEDFKQSWERPAERAPIPHAELLTFSGLAEKGNVDLAAATRRLAARGITGFTPDTIVQHIAERAKLSAKEIFDIMVTPSTQAGDHAKGAGGGAGWKTLAQLCADENLDLAKALSRLKASGYKATEQLTLREIANTKGDHKPYELLEIIRAN